MKWVSALSEHRFLKYAVAECAREISDALGDQKPDLIVTFVSAHHAARYDELSSLVSELFADCFLIGCSGGGVIGAGREVEDRPGLSLTAAVLPDVDIVGFHIDNDDLPDGDAPPSAWEELTHVVAVDDPQFMILTDPFSVQGENLLMGFDYAFPRGAKIGGLGVRRSPTRFQRAVSWRPHLRQRRGRCCASWRHRCGHHSGAGLPSHRSANADYVLRAQYAERARRPRDTFEVLRETFQQLDERDQQLAQHSLFLGVVMDEFNDDPQLGDFLIRNILGVDARRGALAIGEILKEGQTVQFHLRDAETSSHDLDAMLTQYSSDGVPASGAGALLFQCLGRGSYLYGRPDHDTDMFRDKVGNLPLAGFFCNGEIGQVSGSTYLHGYTSSFGIFRPKTPLLPSL